MVTEFELDDYFQKIEQLNANSEEKLDENKLVKIKVFLKALFAKNQPEKPKKCAFLPQKWQKCPSCEHIIKVQFYCPFCGQRVRERHFETISEQLTFGPVDGWGVSS